MRAFTERNPKAIGAIALAIMAVIVLGVIFLNRDVFRSGYAISARFTNAAGIGKGTEVLLAGVEVGTVTSVSITGNRVDVAMTINHGVALPAHTSAAIEVETLLGVVDVTLDPVSGWDRPLRAGAILTDTSVPTEFYQLNNIAGHLLEKTNATALNDVVESLADITKGKRQQVAQIIEGLGKLTTTVSDRSAQVSQLIDSSDTLAATLAAHDQQLATAVGELNTVASGLAAHSAGLADLIDNIESLAAQTNSQVSQDRPALDTVLKNLDTTLGVVDQHQDDLAQAVSYLGGALKGFASVGYSGPDDTPNDWANIYVNALGLAGVTGPLGACGALTSVLTEVLGPTPLACATRTGPLPGASPSNASSTTSQNNTSSTGATAGASASGSAPASSSTTPSAAPDTGLGALSQLLSPLLAGGA